MHTRTTACTTQGVIETLAEVIPERQEAVKKFRAEHGDKSLGDIKVDNLFGGMRGLKVMLWEPSVLDSEEGIRFWGKTIPECQEALPKAKGGKQMLPESMLFFLSGCSFSGAVCRTIVLTYNAPSRSDRQGSQPTADRRPCPRPRQPVRDLAQHGEAH